jgi:hypothetical protein
MTIVERSSGFWIVDFDGVIEGPFLDYEEAEACVRQLESLELANSAKFDSFANDFEG